MKRAPPAVEGEWGKATPVEGSRMMKRWTGVRLPPPPSRAAAVLAKPACTWTGTAAATDFKLAAPSATS